MRSQKNYSLESLFKSLLSMAQIFLIYYQIERIWELNQQLREHAEKVKELSVMFSSSMLDVRNRINSSQITGELLREKLNSTQEVLSSKIDGTNNILLATSQKNNIITEMIPNNYILGIICVAIIAGGTYYFLLPYVKTLTLASILPFFQTSSVISKADNSVIEGATDFTLTRVIQIPSTALNSQSSTVVLDSLANTKLAEIKGEEAEKLMSFVNATFRDV